MRIIIFIALLGFALAGCVKPPAEKCVNGYLWVRNDYGVWVMVDSTPFAKQFTPDAMPR